MNVECLPITALPHTTRLFRDYLDVSNAGADSPMRRFYPMAPFGASPDRAEANWMRSSMHSSRSHQEEIKKRNSLADLLLHQNLRWGAGSAALANIEKLRSGADAVLTGQQVGLFGGPLLTLLKAATAIRKAQNATAAGLPHVPVFWLATEDHDLAEVNNVALPGKHELETLRIAVEDAASAGSARPVGNLRLDASVAAAVARLKDLLGHAPICDRIEAAYAPGATMGDAFARFIANVFAEQGLIVVDASTRGFHALGAATLQAAIEDAEGLHLALLERNAELEANGYHTQVLVPEGGSLLFLLDQTTGARHPLKRSGGAWKANGQSYSTGDLLSILAAEPERLSPNALLRAVFQDTIFPTSAYIGGPAEIAYFAQSQVIYQRILGRTTPVLPRFSATLIEPALAKMMAQHELSLPDVMESADALAQKLGARSMSAESKRRLADTANALDSELAALTEWMQSMDAGLGRSAEVSASKMLYQMNRLRLMAANHELQRNASLRKHADALTLHLFPDQKPQERVLGGVWFLARYGDDLAQLLVDHAEQDCPGHHVFFL